MSGTRQFFLINHRGRKVLVPLADVMWFEAADKYITIGTAEKTFLWEGALDGLQIELAGMFTRTHRHHLVRTNLIEELVFLPSGLRKLTLRGVVKTFDVSRRCWRGVAAAMEMQAQSPRENAA